MQLIYKLKLEKRRGFKNLCFILLGFVEFADQILYNICVNNVFKICSSGDLVKTPTFMVI